MYKNILLFVISILTILSLAELYCRINGKYASYAEQTGAGGYGSPFKVEDPTWYHVFSPHFKLNRKQSEFSVSWTANNEGLKDSDFVIAKDKIRIMAIGDSYTEGVGADNDSSFPKQLSYILRDSIPRRTEVWNCGISGSDLVYEFRLFKDRLLKYDPDMLIVVVNSSDINDVVVRGGFERFQPDGSLRYRKGPWFEPLYARSYLVRRLVHDGLKYDRQFMPAGESTKMRTDAIHTLTMAIDSFTRLCADRNIKLLFVIHPTLGEFDNIMKYESTPLISYCRDRHLPYIDIKAELNSMGLDSVHGPELFWHQDWHCKNKGYQYFAKCVWRRVGAILDK